MLVVGAEGEFGLVERTEYRQDGRPLHRARRRAHHPRAVQGAFILGRISQDVDTTDLIAELFDLSV